jgi:hypothetical protein
LTVAQKKELNPPAPVVPAVGDQQQLDLQTVNGATGAAVNGNGNGP